MIRVHNFKGLIPRLSASLLPDNNSQTANNTDLRSGEIRAFVDTLPVNNPTKSGTVTAIYRWATEPDAEAQAQIAGVGSTTPIRIASQDHGRTTGDRVFIAGTGLSIDDATYVVTNITDDVFSLDGTSAAGDAFTGTWALENGYWLHWVSTEDTGDFGIDVARGAVNDDTSYMTFFTGEDASGIAPRLLFSPNAEGGAGTDYPKDSNLLGIPAPTAAPTSQTPAGTGDGTETTHAWVYTFVGTYANRKFEGPPSSPSDSQDVEGGETETLTGIENAPPGDYNITHQRLYRSVSGTSGSLFYFVEERAVSNADWEDTMGSYGDPIETTLYDPPPSDMHSIIALPNGGMAGLSGNALCLSVPYAPHAWPTDYQEKNTMESEGVGLAVLGQSIVVLTETRPYLATGTDPNSVTMKRLPLNQACVSKKSIVHLDKLGVMYASPDGLVLVHPGGVELLSEDWLSKKEWQTYKPSSIHAYQWDGRYVAFYDNGTTQAGFIFDPKGFGLIHIDTYATAGFEDPLSDELYLLVSQRIEKWAGGYSVNSFTWKSKVFTEPQPLNLNTVQVIATSYASLTVSVWADGVLKADAVSVTSAEGFRALAGNFTARQWEIQVAGTDDVMEVVLAESMSDLARV